VISGEQERALRFRDPSVGAFIASLFHAIQMNTVSRVELLPYDLYHGHIFLSIVELPSAPQTFGPKAPTAPTATGSGPATSASSSASSSSSTSSSSSSTPPPPPATGASQLQSADPVGGTSSSAHASEPAVQHLACELGILFHAKEFPLEFRATQEGPIYPVGSPQTGGAKDPRKGAAAPSAERTLLQLARRFVSV
jgi:hypothetical protein